MKDKEKQIEEMAEIIDDCTWVTDENYCEIISCEECHAKRLYDLGYRKPSENVFILTDDNVEELANLIVTSPQMQSVMGELIKAWQKETAEKVIMDFYHELITYFKGRVITYGSFCKVAKKHNVQIPQETFTVAQQVERKE